MGFDEVILTFVVVVLGGIGSVGGSLLAGFGLGMFTALFGALVSPAYTTAAAFLVLLAVLVLRPRGFGRAMTVRSSLATPFALLLAALAYFVPAVAGGAPVAYAACTTIAILAVMSYGADLILSYLGEVSLGHTIFWAAGGYAAAMLAVNAGWNGWPTAAAAVVVSIVLAVVLGLATLAHRASSFSRW